MATPDQLTEDDRAVAYRQQCANQTAYRQREQEALAGDPVAAAAVRLAWAPVLPQSLDAWDCPPEPEPPRPAWVGRVPANVELPEYLKHP